MSDAKITLEQADSEALSYVERLLDANGLPSVDVQAKNECFYVASVRGERVGIGGLERYGADALLRSLVIEQSARGNGYGAALCDALEARAAKMGLERLFLLTTTAESFFASRGYDERERRAAPESIRTTTEFAELCPASATCLAKSL
ncbi:arsenic resistance N-acetyltransferase ArsN2 [Natronolimnobius baerhuensis]|uniref:GNAT family N-acetyltransferase n=1 Tax=Natronolimnobius baerhuensis TaxID=253108 RepID=A0A202EBX2_9EURY|nr:arsenic resistance N-acetyltransferase ArsN2 [Natronolimnobius baerhuensis]OVE85744.1 GNAT family N-acetyltransferase [Natronolimnobius baerhuensis]